MALEQIQNVRKRGGARGSGRDQTITCESHQNSSQVHGISKYRSKKDEVAETVNLSLGVQYVCVCTYVCRPLCIHVQRPRGHVGCPFILLPYFSEKERERESLNEPGTPDFWLDWLTRMPQPSYCVCPQSVLGFQACVTMTSFNCELL